MDLKLTKPFYVLSKKYYAGGEVTIEFVVLDNDKEISANLIITFKDRATADLFELRKEYDISFEQRKEN